LGFTIATMVDDRWVETKRGRLFARLWDGHDADAAPIVLLHDSLGCVRLWRTFPGALAEATARRVIAYDRLGFGQSDGRTDKLGRDFIHEEAVEFFPALREQWGFDRFVLFGHSVGGGMAVNCAAEFPGACEALITESAQAFVEDRTHAGLRAAEASFENPEQLERLKRYHGEKAQWVLEAWIRTWLSPEFQGWSLDDVLPRVQCRTLAMHGSEDEYGSVRHPERIARGTGGEIDIIQGAGHVPHREREEWVCARVREFLEEK
jgi:pimeloyl-ACP methyl ester carboxylesterase